MGLIECTSGNSLWRGYDYYKEKKVSNPEKIGDGIYHAQVAGSNNIFYDVEIDISHPRRSTCNCPHADGKRVVCKHMIATYFTVFPDEAERINNEAMAYEEEEKQRREELEQRMIKHIRKMKKSELEDALLQILLCGPEWQYDRFIRDHLGEYV